MSEDVFDQNTESESVSVVAELVGEGKKFATIEDLARGKQEADSFIKQLEEENAGMREQMKKAEELSNNEATLQELIKAVRNSQQEDEGDKTGITEDDLSNKVKEILRGESEAQTRARNREKGNQLVLDKTGGDIEAARTYMAERAKQLAMSVKELRELSERSPEAFAELINTKPSTNSPPINQIDGGASGTTFQPKGEEVVDGAHTAAYYARLKEEMGAAAYWNDLDLQNQRYKDAMKLGERFNQ